MDGTNRNDFIIGSGLVDTIDGGLGDDTIQGLAADDRLEGGNGNDSLEGGEGSDSLYGSNGNDTLIGDSGNDTIDGGTGNDSLDGGANNDVIDGGNGNDSIDGGEGDDTIDGDTGNDTLVGDAGNDVIDAGNGNDTVNAGAGNDSVIGDTGNDDLIGGDGDDTIDAGHGNDTVDAGAGNDSVIGDTGNDELIGGDGNDTIDAGHGNDTIDAGADNDVIIGDTGDDFIQAGSGNDLVDGGHGRDTLFGGQGDDTLVGDTGDDIIEGGDGNDVVDGGINNDTITGSAGDDHLQGAGGNDVIDGGEGNDLIDGGENNDTLIGGLGADTLLGGAGNDSIVVGQDVPSADASPVPGVIDVVDGGQGNDTIVVGQAVTASSQVLFGRGDGRDIITLGDNSSGLESLSLVFKSGVSPEDLVLNTPSSSQSDISFGIVNTGDALTLDAAFHAVLDDVAISFEDGGFISGADIATAITSAQAEGIRIVDLSSLVQAQAPSDQDSHVIQGTQQADDLEGTEADELILSEGVASGIESVRGNGGSDRLIIDSGDNHASDGADDRNGHFRIRDFVIDDVETNDQADILDIGAFLNQSGLDANTIGDYLHVVSGVYGLNTTGVFVNRDGNFTDQARINLTNDPVAGGNGADLFLEFQGRGGSNNFAQITGEADNTVEQFQALIDLGFLDLSRVSSVPEDESDQEQSVTNGNWVQVGATGAADSLNGTSENEAFYSGGVSEQIGIVSGTGPYAPGQGRFYYGPGAESISGNGGGDKLVLDSDDSFFQDSAGDNNGHIRIRDFTIGDTATNDQADSLDIGAFLNGTNLNASNIGNYLHVISAVYGSPNRTGVFIDRDGLFTDEDRAALDADVVAGGHGADLYLEFQGFEDASLGEFVQNNFAQVTGYADNTVEQFQALIDLGFLDLSASFDENGPAAEVEPEPVGPLTVNGSEFNDNLIGSIGDELIFSGGVKSGTESVQGNGGQDTYIIDSNDALVIDSADNSDGHVRIRDFTIGNVSENAEADVLDISDLLNFDGLDADGIGNYLHVISGLYGTTRTGVFIDKDGAFTEDDRAALDSNPVAGGHGADIFLEFQGHAANNNFEDITGYADNTTEQFRSLIDLGFLAIA